MSPDNLTALLEEKAARLREELCQDAVFCWACAPLDEGLTFHIRSNQVCQVPCNGCGFIASPESDDPDHRVVVRN